MKMNFFLKFVKDKIKDYIFLIFLYINNNNNINNLN